MSIRARRAIIKICIVISAAALVWVTVWTVTGHHGGGRTVAACLFPALSILSGALFLRSTRGRS